MLKKLAAQPQLEMFKIVLSSFINPQHELCLLAKEIDWAYSGEIRRIRINEYFETWQYLSDSTVWNYVHYINVKSRKRTFGVIGNIIGRICQ
jgi:hypothetical protein